MRFKKSLMIMAVSSFCLLSCASDDTLSLQWITRHTADDISLICCARYRRGSGHEFYPLDKTDYQTFFNEIDVRYVIVSGTIATTDKIYYTLDFKTDKYAFFVYFTDDNLVVIHDDSKLESNYFVSTTPVDPHKLPLSWKVL